MCQVSVIVPVFNTVAYISRCCHSLFSQTMSDLQFIFVDDGSTDGSLDVVLSILSQYNDRVGQTTILTQSHQGVSAARQRGLDQAVGEYVIHCDSDDWVESDSYQKLYDCAVASKADIVTCGYTCEYPLSPSTHIVPALQVDTLVSFSIGPQTGSLCLKLIRRELIVKYNLKLPQGINWGEDLCLSLQALLLSQKTVVVNMPLYHYMQHSDSITHTLTLERCTELVQCGQIMEHFLSQHELTSLYASQLNWLKFQLKQYYLIFHHSRDLSLWESTYPECHKDILNYNCAVYLKVVIFLVLHRHHKFATLLLRLRDRMSVTLSS